MAPHPSTPDLVVLHGLRCIGAASAARVAEAVRRPLPEVESGLIDLGIAGLVGYTPGPFSGWSLTEDGRHELSRRLAAELDAANAREAVEQAHRTFSELNPLVLDVLTDWQLRSREPSQANDHSDPTYDARVLRKLSLLHERAEPVCAELAGTLERFSPYGVRLATALERARGGDFAAVTNTTDSYHSVWFQLHEDLLVSLGIPRW